MKTVGIVGFGSFGKFLAEKLSSHAKVLVHSPSQVPSSWAAPIEEVAQADYVILAVPVQYYPDVIDQLKPHLRPDTVIVDVCSVKVQPMERLRELLPDHALVATHPMFGPESAGFRLNGHTIIMCPEASAPAPYDAIKQFAESLGLTVIEMTCDEHDAEIAVVQGLTFFIARTLNTMGIHDQTLHTPSFQRLLDLANLEEHHSQKLFETIQSGNPHTADVRAAFLRAAEELNSHIHNN